MKQNKRLEALTALMEAEGDTVTLNVPHVLEDEAGFPEAIQVDSHKGTLAPLLLTAREWEDLARYLVKQRKTPTELHKTVHGQQQNIVKLSAELARTREQLEETQVSLSLAESKAQTYLTALNAHETKDK